MGLIKSLLGLVVCILALPSCLQLNATHSQESTKTIEPPTETDSEPYGLTERVQVGTLVLPGDIQGRGNSPVNLSETGLFSDLATLEPAAGVLPYDVNVPLWLSGAEKKRFIALPGDSKINYSSTAPWIFPDGTVLVKHFEILLSDGTIQRLETRLLIKFGGNFDGFLYKWNAAGTEAVLQVDPVADETFTVDGSIVGRPAEAVDVTWKYPVNSCAGCHNPAVGDGILGIQAAQLNRPYPYAARTDNQLRAFNHIGLFVQNIEAVNSYNKTSQVFTSLNRFKDLSDTNMNLADRFKSYVAANCAACHQPGGTADFVGIDYRYGTPVSGMGLVNVNSRIVPGDPSASVLWQRIGGDSVDLTSTMPPVGIVGSLHSNPDAVRVIAEWINSL